MTGPAQPRRSAATHAALGVAIAGIVLWYFVVMWARPTLVGDEYHHVPAIRDLARGDWRAAHELPMPPTYHLLASLPVRWLGGSLWVLRGFDVLVAVLAVLGFHLAAKAYRPDYGPHDLLRFAWNPLLLPFWVLVYTDVASLLALLVALLLHVRRRYLLAAVALLAACLIRQSNVVWASFFAIWGAVELRGAILRRNGAATPVTAGLGSGRSIRCLWPYGLLLAVLGVLAVVGRELLLPKVPENAVRPNVAQFHVLALTAALLWAPVWIGHLVRFWSDRFAPALLRPWVCAALIAAVGLLALAFANPHQWNQDPAYARNWPLLAMGGGVAARLLPVAVVVAFLVAFADHTWRSPARVLLFLTWAFAGLFVLPHYLVDPRYYIVPVVLIDSLTPYTASQARRLTAWYLLLTLAAGALLVIQPRGSGGIW